MDACTYTLDNETCLALKSLGTYWYHSSPYHHSPLCCKTYQSPRSIGAHFVVVINDCWISYIFNKFLGQYRSLSLYISDRFILFLALHDQIMLHAFMIDIARVVEWLNVIRSVNHLLFGFTPLDPNPTVHSICWPITDSSLSFIGSSTSMSS